MIRSLAAALLAASFIAGPASAQDPAYLAILNRDAPKAADHALTGRYDGSRLLGQTVKAFDELALPSGAAQGPTYSNDKKFSATVSAQGKVTRSLYVSPAGRSSLEVFTNYREALAAKGFEPVFECARDACGESFNVLKYNWQNKAAHPSDEAYEQVRNLLIQAMFDSVLDPRYALMRKAAPEGDTLVAVYAALNRGGSMGSFSDLLRERVGVLVEVVEPRTMDRRMVTISAAEIGGKLAAEGRAVFYNILFDFDKADLKPESDPQLEQMADYLRQNPQAKVFVIGHTDGKGGLDYNTKLSGRRAEAVAKALSTRYRIDARRLVPRGLGPLAPVATNRTEEGQAKNRRVELVEQ